MVNLRHKQKQTKMNQLRFFWVLLLPLAFLLPSCKEAHEHEHDHDHAAAINMDSVKMQIAALEAAFAKESNAGNVDGVAAYYSSDAESLAPDEPTRVGMDAIKAGIKREMERDSLRSTVAFATTGVWADGKYAVETGTITNTDKAGKVVYSGKYMTLFELRDGKYIAIRDMWNSNAPHVD